MRYRYQVQLAYDGTEFHGSQFQTDLRTVQGEVAKSLGKLGWQGTAVLFAGRTDAGVHAIHQVANFKVFSDIPPSAFLRGLNSLLPDSIVIKQAEYVSLDFHARYDASSKIY